VIDAVERLMHRVCELALMRVLVLDRGVPSEPDHLAWSRPGTLLQCLELPKGTLEGAVAGLGTRTVKLNLCTLLYERERVEERDRRSAKTSHDPVAPPRKRSL
jgi:hypothetical protein